MEAGMDELIVSPNGRKYGAIKDAPDPRDYSLSAQLSINLPLPPKTNNIVFRGPIKDQGNESSCTGHGSTSQMEFLQRKYNNNPVILSPAFIYYMERKMEGTLTDGDCGAQVRTSVKAMNQYGCCTLVQEPYSDQDYSTAPTADQLQAAMKYAGGAYHSIGVFADMKTCLASGYGFVLGMVVYESFEGDEIARTGLMPVPDVLRERQAGGHEVFAIDYDDTIECPGAKYRGALIVQNSWGPEWGDGGMFKMPYEVAADARVVNAAWMQHLGGKWIPKHAVV
jgi:C1A family cysteine protease